VNTARIGFLWSVPAGSRRLWEGQEGQGRQKAKTAPPKIVRAARVPGRASIRADRGDRRAPTGWEEDSAKTARRTDLSCLHGSGNDQVSEPVRTASGGPNGRAGLHGVELEGRPALTAKASQRPGFSCAPDRTREARSGRASCNPLLARVAPSGQHAARRRRHAGGGRHLDGSRDARWPSLAPSRRRPNPCSRPGSGARRVLGFYIRWRTGEGPEPARCVSAAGA